MTSGVSMAVGGIYITLDGVTLKKKINNDKDIYVTSRAGRSLKAFNSTPSGIRISLHAIHISDFLMTLAPLDFTRYFYCPYLWIVASGSR